MKLGILQILRLRVSRSLHRGRGLKLHFSCPFCYNIIGRSLHRGRGLKLAILDDLDIAPDVAPCIGGVD